MEAWMFIAPLLCVLGLVPLAVRIHASRSLRRRLESDWSGLVERWDLQPGPLYWYSTLNLYRVQPRYKMHLVADRALLGPDVRFWSTWFIVVVELKPPARLAPADSSSYLVSVSDGMKLDLQAGTARSLGLLPKKDDGELIPGVYFDGTPPELTQEIIAILERWFIPGHGFVGEEGISLAWRPGPGMDPAEVEQALKDATALAHWLRPGPA